MAFSHSPKIATDGLVFYYDTGNGKSYKGEPTTNLIPGVANPSLSVSGWYETGWTGAMAVHTTEDALVLTATNGWHSMSYDFGVAGSPVTVQFKFKLKSQQTSNIYMVVLNGNHLGDYAQSIGNDLQSGTQYPTLDGYKTFRGTFTPDASTKICIVLRGSDGQGLTDEMFIKELQVEQKDHATQFVNGSRSVTEGLLDLTKNETVNLSNAGFNSSAQLIYDGTSDYLTVPQPNIQNSQGFSIELVIKPDSFSNSPMLITPQSAGIDHYYFTSTIWI